MGSRLRRSLLSFIERSVFLPLLRLTPAQALAQIVMRGLDPRIHLVRQKFYEADGLPGQARQ